jgi:hypothetical protein
MFLFVAVGCLISCGSVIEPSAECQKYLACLEGISVGSSASVIGSYGEKGTCWSIDQRAADSCTAACKQGLSTKQAGMGKDVPACK